MAVSSQSLIFKWGVIAIALTTVFIVIRIAGFPAAESDETSSPVRDLSSPQAATAATFEIQGDFEPFLIAVWQDAYPEQAEEIFRRLQTESTQGSGRTLIDKSKVNPSLIGLNGWDRNVINVWFLKYEDGSRSRSDHKVTFLPSESRLIVVQDREAIDVFQSRFSRFWK